MIHYALRCASGHDFDGWFRSSGDFDTQADSGLLDCPVCASTLVTRALMAPRLSVSGVNAAPDAVPPERPPSLPDATPPAMPSQMRAALQRLRAEVEQRCDYVGPQFAEAARAIHDGAQPPRAIYGETTQDEAQSLADDGIAVSRIPWVERADG